MILFQLCCDLFQRLPIQIAVEDPGDHSSAFRFDLRFSIRTFPVAQEVAVMKGKLSLFILPPLSHSHILADGFAFRLSEGAEPGEVNFAADIAGI